MFDGAELLVAYQIPEGHGHLVADPELVRALREDPEQNRLKYRRPPEAHKGKARTLGPVRTPWAVTVQYRPITEYPRRRDSAMSDLLIDRVQQNLRRLRFVRAPEDLSEILAQAERESLSPLSVLDMVLDLEVASKEDRRIATSLKLASLPFVKTIDEYDCAFHPDLDKTQVMSLFDLTFLSRQENVLLLGPPGVGKTHLAVALAVKVAQAGHSIYFTTMADLVTKLKEDENSGRSIKARSHSKAALVVVDEVGYTPIDRRECYLFFRFVSRRYEKASLVITSNKGFAEWTELFEDPIIVAALLDRLLHHSVIVNIRGQSYRLRGKNSSIRKVTAAA